MFSATGRRCLVVALLSGLLSTAPALAALTAEVRDEAKMFKPETVKEADAIIRAIKRDHSLDLLI
ncbi:MAG TPA: hypothetical protein VKA46_24685, partial [Gemmataceae bacterium]|nr:hypothetical protein [Gemmataceae bacterium]